MVRILGILVICALVGARATMGFAGPDLSADLSKVKGGCFSNIQHPCTVTMSCVQSYPDCDGNCDTACAGAGTHHYGLPGSFYESFTLVQKPGCGFLFVGFTCSPGQGGACGCAGNAQMNGQCTYFDLEDTVLCGS